MRDDCITIALDLPEVRVISQEETAEEIKVEVMCRSKGTRCPRCGQATGKVHSVSVQNKRDRRLRDKAVFLRLHKRRFRCLWCGKVFTEPDPVCGNRRRSSKRFRSYLGLEAIEQPVRHVARKEGVGEGLVRRCVTEEAEKILECTGNLGRSRVLGLDEFSVKKGQVYDTAVADMERKLVIGVVSGRRQKEVAAFLDTLSEPEGVEVVVMDMHEPFRQAVELSLTNAKIVVDKFHVLMHVNRALDQVRKSLKPARGKRRELFSARHLLLKAEEQLTQEQRSQLMELLRLYPALQNAWSLKEAFRKWYWLPTRKQAEEELVLWEGAVREQGLSPFKSLLPMLQTWRQEILNYFDHRYTNGFLEGKNNRIKVIKRIAYGYRNPTNFRYRILLTNRKEMLSVAA